MIERQRCERIGGLGGRERFAQSVLIGIHLREGADFELLADVVLQHQVPELRRPAERIDGEDRKFVLPRKVLLER